MVSLSDVNFFQTFTDLADPQNVDIRGVLATFS